MAVQAMEAFAIGYAALPFILSFEQISSEIHFTHSHSLLYQLLILWGLPVCTVIGYVVMLFKERRAAQTEFPAVAAKTAAAGAGPAAPRIRLRRVRQRTERGTACSAKTRFSGAGSYCPAFFRACAVGLVILPEVIYVKDIYTGYYRANTMFKLTYQAFYPVWDLDGVYPCPGACFREEDGASDGRCRPDSPCAYGRVYFHRLRFMVRQYFDASKGSARMLPCLSMRISLRFRRHQLAE